MTNDIAFQFKLTDLKKFSLFDFYKMDKPMIKKLEEPKREEPKREEAKEEKKDIKPSLSAELKDDKKDLKEEMSASCPIRIEKNGNITILDKSFDVKEIEKRG